MMKKNIGHLNKKGVDFMGKRYKYVIVAGCSRFGASIASSLSLQGNDVIVIDKDKKSFRKLLYNYSGFKMHGDATDVDILIEAGIKKSGYNFSCHR